MPRKPPKSCRECGRHPDECGRISIRGLCIDCAVNRQLDNARQLRAHSGPWFDHWRSSCAASVGAKIERDV